MDISTKVNIALSVLSFILAAISIVNVVITLLQNSKMIENSTRPYICIYGQSINPGCLEFYLVVRNFGNSAAVITKFEYEPDISSCFGVSNCRNFLNDLQNAALAPGQSRICKLKYSLVPDYVTFKIEYNSGVKKYSEIFSCNIKAGTSMLTGKIDTTGKELRTISYTLQEMLQKNL